MLKKIVSAALCLPVLYTFSAAETVFFLIQDEPVEYLGGAPELQTKDAIDGKLTVSKTEIHFTCSKGAVVLDPQKVTRLSGGEWAKRRVKGSVAGAILLTPLFLFALIGKKKRDILLIEYSDKKAETPEGQEPEIAGAVILRYKQKEGRAIMIERALESVTGLTVEKEAPKEKEKKKDRE